VGAGAVANAASEAGVSEAPDGVVAGSGAVWVDAGGAALAGADAVVAGIARGVGAYFSTVLMKGSASLGKGVSPPRIVRKGMSFR